MCNRCCGCHCGDDDEDEQDLTGPLENRSCQDIIWLLAFIGFWVGMLVIGGFALDNGEPLRLIYGVDSYGNICGTTNTRQVNDSNSGLDMTNYKYLYYQDPTDFGTLKLCVSECPSVSSGTLDCSTASNCNGANNLTNICLSGVYSIHGASANSIATPDLDKGDNGDGCPDVIYDSSNALGLRRCVPSESLSGAFASYVTSFYSDLNGSETIQRILADFQHAALRILYCCLIAFGLACLCIILLRFFVKIMVYTLIFASCVLLIAITGVLWRQYKKLKDDLPPEDVRLEEEEDNVKMFLAFAIISSIFTGLFLLILLAMRNRIRLAVTIFQEASDAIGSMPLIMLTPIFTYIFMLAFFMYWVFVYVYLATSGFYELDNRSHADYTQDGDYTKMWWYHLFGLFWSSQFILACEQVVLAGAFATFYFTRDKSDVRLPFLRSLYRLLRYHLGSVALGSLIIAIIQFARAILAYVQKKTKNKTGALVQYFLKCIACCLWCFEKCMKFINKNAYIEIAIYGYSFCHAARRAFFLLLTNILRVAALNGIGVLVLFLCKLCVIFLTAIIAVVWLRDDDELHYYGLVLLVIIVFSYLIADTFFDVYKMGIDTIFLCFLEDCKRNNGKDKPYYMSDRLLKLMKSGAKNQPTKDDDGQDDAAKNKGEPPKYQEAPKD
eukprot:m.189895 g.189895  ORF g.189895 m.189895 type:complete len:667 (+) comp25677_c0_seq7:74-2074(+)